MVSLSRGGREDEVLISQWYQTIDAFRCGMPRRSHWHIFRQYEQTFSGAEAAVWMRRYLCSLPQFSGTGSVSKQQTLTLLGKFLKAAVFERVRPAATASAGRNDVKDNGELYR